MRPAGGGLIGPNAITRIAQALSGEERAAVFRAAELERHLARPPDAMVPDEDVARLHGALHARLGTARALAAGARAGRLTGLYLLRHRIPPLARRLLPLLPRRLALAILFRAIARHAWTFAGKGAFTCRAGLQPEFRIAGGPVGRLVRAKIPVCAYYAATFETILRRLVDPGARVVETACEATGAAECVFSVRF
jgi:divinyl protochlorophyllide a 8-vinyl-reductase